VRRDTQHALLLLLGGALARLALDGTYLRYVRPSHQWPLLGAGLVMLVLAVVALRRDRSGAADHDHEGADRHVPWLLAVPVLAIALVAPPALGADAVARAGSGNAASAGELLAPLPEGVPELPLAELVQRAGTGPAGGVEGREVVLTGFVVRHGAAVDLARLRIACCAADARPARVRLAGDLGLAPPAPDTWLRVRGVVVAGTATAASGHVPTLAVTLVEVVTPPPDPYEY
jgi:uncharacterized repeat protein (TIGR03943 family)